MCVCLLLRAPSPLNLDAPISCLEIPPLKRCECPRPAGIHLHSHLRSLVKMGKGVGGGNRRPSSVCLLCALIRITLSGPGWHWGSLGVGFRVYDLSPGAHPRRGRGGNVVLLRLGMTVATSRHSMGASIPPAAPFQVTGRAYRCVTVRLAARRIIGRCARGAIGRRFRPASKAKEYDERNEQQQHCKQPPAQPHK